MDPSTTESSPESLPDLLRRAGAGIAHGHAAERILAIGRSQVPSLRWKPQSHLRSQPSAKPGFLHFVASADGWNPDIAQLHLRWERPMARPDAPELSLDATAGGFEHQGELRFQAPRTELRERLRFQSANDTHCESLVAGELAQARRLLLHLRLVHADGIWRLAPQHLLSSWPLTLSRPADLRFAQPRDAYRLIAWLIHALDGYRLLSADP